MIGRFCEASIDGFNPRPGAIQTDVYKALPLPEGEGAREGHAPIAHFGCHPPLALWERAGVRVFAWVHQFASHPPRPALLPGDAHQVLHLDQRRRVSIHARHCCRAMPSRRCMPSLSSRFQSTPGIAAGRCSKPRAPSVTGRCFNPRPALLPGDAPWPLPPLQVFESFNPRPALLPGDARLARTVAHTPSRFNPRPALLPGDALLRSRMQPANAFQSTPGIAAGRCARQENHGPPSAQFQSTPGIAAGRCTSPPKGCQQRHFWCIRANLVARQDSHCAFE